ncbi:hypothetical protein CPAST_c18600 [Clostridium pasteurianum DSM 525 = ATCC 6013]|uniref:Division initiation protein n=3 Tax=Clostridium pasteurianum TaxID=1501 RepID=A0A0H3J9S0_CLOPA|nr:DUF881 domain-containing protein [Clostridium pasteurianum]AJA47930.1 hypothetical protein CPAST_c18600 [Clostridium pasteurianum DSM 525 = ATCC 6013]AJA51918.1 hypothetical protein CLPA_c18600 [Clostridium pasteurianum DSM 525 = ATCC 6013]AOZ75217.1 hypothetical protein AQ983_09025 [Clostridium pasteurianum DSM 525 = ATCC 6013]AOZ79012.1 hypothetical protein AQ984_09015 [Clostridium pasteurianum]ELP59833.1 hypothetical protein F502_08208 [Clostridium pasteurianum DSM 525 = ATCC 6013]
MKRIRSQIAVALVCCILGFMLAYQFRIISLQESNISLQGDSSQITSQVEQLNKEKEDLNKKVNELQTKLKQYQDAAVTKSGADKQMIDELNNLNALIGSEDVQGQGIIITITPRNIFSSDIDGVGNVITDKALTNIVNELRFAGAEAISINNIRVTSYTGIKTSGGVSNIFIGSSDKISPYDTITIKAIGNKEDLNSGMVFPGVLYNNPDIPSAAYIVATPQKSDNIKIPKSNKVFNFQYARPAAK